LKSGGDPWSSASINQIVIQIKQQIDSFYRSAASNFQLLQKNLDKKEIKNTG
jgi:hypothetical protein